MSDFVDHRIQSQRCLILLYMEFYVNMLKMLWQKPENCQNRNLHNPKTGYLLVVCFTKQQVSNWAHLHFGAAYKIWLKLVNTYQM